MACISFFLIWIILILTLATIDQELTYVSSWVMISADSLLYFFAYAGSAVLTLGILALFSLSCKGKNRKLRFIQSYYASGVSSIAGTALIVIVGCIMLALDEGYDDNNFFWVWSFCPAIILLFAPALSAVWFYNADKYTVTTERIKNKKALILPVVFIIVYGILYYLVFVRDILLTYKFVYDMEFFSKVDNNVGFYFSHLIRYVILYSVLFLFSISCKGGHKRLSFIGSVFMGEKMTLFVSPLLTLLVDFVCYKFELVNDELWIPSSDIIEGVRLFIATVIAVLLFIYLNRYEVEKIKKKKNNETPDVLSEEKPEPAAVLQQ